MRTSADSRMWRQDQPDEGVHSHHYPLPKEPAKVVGEVNQPLQCLTGPMLKSEQVGISKLNKVRARTILIPFDRVPVTRLRTRCRSRWNGLSVPRSSIRIL